MVDLDYHKPASPKGAFRWGYLAIALPIMGYGIGVFLKILSMEVFPSMGGGDKYLFAGLIGGVVSGALASIVGLMRDRHQKFLSIIGAALVVLVALVLFLG